MNRAIIDSQPPWDLDLRPLLQIPTMVSQHELRYLRWLGATHWDGRSHAVEFGPWLGATTAALAQGMLESPYRAGGRLHTFDSFIWRHFMDSRAGFALASGMSFQPHFSVNTSLFADIIRAHACSLPDDPHHFSPHRSGPSDTPPLEPFRWKSHELISILFLDGAKSWTALCHILHEVAHAMVPGNTILVCQDYRDPFAFWHPLVLEMRGSSITLEHVLPSDTCSFRVTKPIAHLVDQLPPIGAMSTDAAVALIDRAADRIAGESPEGSCLVRLGAAAMLAVMGEWAKSEQRYGEIARCPTSAAVERVLALFEQAFHLNRGRFPRAGWLPRHRRLQARFPSYRRLSRAVRRVLPL